LLAAIDDHRVGPLLTEKLAVAYHDVDITGVRYRGIVDLENRLWNFCRFLPEFFCPSPRSHKRMTVGELIERRDHGIARRRAGGYLQDERAFVDALEPIEALRQLDFRLPQ
jgi:hypothetical protein